MEKKYGIPKKDLQYLVSQFKISADKNRDGKIDIEEWNVWLDEQTKQPLENHPKAEAFAQVVAYSERWSCKPPTLFIPTIIILQILFFLFT